MNKEKIKNILWMILAVAVIGYCAYSFLTDPPQDIEDTNGEQDSSIAVITEEEIIAYDAAKSKGMSRSKTDVAIGGIQLGDIRFHSKNFSGVEPLLRTDILFTTGFDLNIYNYKVEAGNFRLYVLNEGKIIDIIEPSDTFNHCYEDIKGEFVVVAVGESAEFQFEMTHADYNEYYHFAFE